MYTQVRPQGDYMHDYVMPILNQNVIMEDKKKEAIEAMGMSACQAKCLRCQHCSNQKCGRRS